MEAIHDSAVQQLMEQIRNQDTQILGWTRTLVAVEGGLLGAVGILWNASAVGIHSKFVGTIAVALLGIVVAKACKDVILSASKWQARYMGYLKVLPGNSSIFSDWEVPAKPGGVVVTAVERVAAAVYVLWSLVGVTALGKLVALSPYLLGKR